MEIPAKDRGKYYAVILRSSAFSWGQVAFSGAFRRAETTAPVPAAGARCTCCDEPTERKQKLDPSTDRHQVAPMWLPVCEACQPHALRTTMTEAILGVGVVSLCGLVGWAYMEHLLWISAAAFVALAFLLAYLLRRSGRRKELVAQGHHAALEIACVPGQTVVRTTNRRLVEELVALNEAAVTRVR